MTLTAGGAERVAERAGPSAGRPEGEPASVDAPFPRTSRVRQAVLIGLYLAGLGWALLHRSALRSLGDHASRVYLAGAALVVAAVISVVSIVLLAAISVTQLVETGRSGGRWHWRSLRRNAEGTLASVVDHRLFMTGWLLNCFGVFLPMLVFISFILTTLPRSSWGLAVAPAVDLVLSLLLRIPIHLQICRIRRLRGEAT